MSNTSIIKSFHGNRLNIIFYRGEALFIASQVGEAMGYREGRALVDNISRRWKDEFLLNKDFRILKGKELEAFKKEGELSDNLLESQTPALMVLTESGVNVACLKTSQPLGKLLRRWLADQILPRLVGSKSSLQPIAPTVPAVDLSSSPPEHLEMVLAHLNSLHDDGIINKETLRAHQTRIVKSVTGYDVSSVPPVVYANVVVPTNVPVPPTGEADGQMQVTATVPVDSEEEDVGYYVGKRVEKDDMYSMSAIGKTYGLTAREVGDAARAHGVHGKEEFGVFVNVDLNGETKNQQFRFNDAGVAELHPHLVNLRDLKSRRLLEVEAQRAAKAAEKANKKSAKKSAKKAKAAKKVAVETAEQIVQRTFIERQTPEDAARDLGDPRTTLLPEAIGFGGGAPPNGGLPPVISGK